MPGQKEEDFDRPPAPIFCQICDREVVVKRGPAFCEEHSRHFEVRQREGASTQELSRRWLDALDNWRERPAELDAETGRQAASTLLRFHQRDGAWVLFMRAYAANDYQAPRLPDGLAVNTHTGEIRRFVDASEQDILDDLRGVRPAPYQTELAGHWGNPAPSGLKAKLEQAYLDAQQQLSFPALVQALPFPAYGLEGRPLDLSVCSVSWGSSGYRLTSVGVTYSSQRYPQVREAVEIGSGDAHDLNVVHRPNSREAPPLWTGECTIDGKVFVGEIQRWSYPPEFARLLPAAFQQREQTGFYLKGEETIVGGRVCGPSVDELLTLLHGLVVLNHHTDLLEQYQRELDQERTRLFGGWGNVSR